MKELGCDPGTQRVKKPSEKGPRSLFGGTWGAVQTGIAASGGHSPLFGTMFLQKGFWDPFLMVFSPFVFHDHSPVPAKRVLGPFLEGFLTPIENLPKIIEIPFFVPFGLLPYLTQCSCRALHGASNLYSSLSNIQG